MQNQKAGLFIVASLVLALAVVTANASTQNSTSAIENLSTEDTASAANPPNAWLRISAFTDVPLAGATVTVYDSSGQILLQEYQATNDRGVYPAWVDGLPRDFRVTVTSDSDQQAALGSRCPGMYTLSADVRNFDPTYGIVYIDPGTTLVSRLMDEDARLNLRQARAQVRSFLDLPDDASLGAALRGEKYYHSQYFSERAFMTQAARSGGVDTFLDSLVNQMVAHPQKQHPFPVANQVVPPALAFIRTNLASAAFHWIFGEGVGWILQSSGLSTPGATPDAIENLQKGLADLQSSVDELSRQLQLLTQQVIAKLTQTQYNQIVVPAVALAAQVNGVESNLAFYAQGCPPLPEDSVTSTGPVFSDFCRDQKVTITSQLNDILINHSFETLSAFLLDNQTAGFKGMLHLYSQALGETVPFFRPADSTKMQNMFNYWDGVQTQGANLKVELLHLNGAQNNPGGIAQLKNFLGDVKATPPVKGKFQETRDRELKLIFPAVPVGTVINTKDRRMWPTSYPNPTLGPKCVLPSYPPNTNGLYGPAEHPAVLNGVPGWRSPSQTEVQALIARRTGPSPIAWLIDQTKAIAPDLPLSAGFPDISKFLPNRCFEGRITGWTNTSTGTWTWLDGRKGNIYYVFRLDNGEISTPKFVSWAHFSTNSYNWTYLDRELAPGEQYYWYP